MRTIDWLDGRIRIIDQTRLPAELRTVDITEVDAPAGVESGSALGVIQRLHADRPLELVYACETRPLLQGSRLTAWELDRLGIPARVIVDSAAAGLVVGGRVDAVVVGADRIAANGDVANKVGTLAHALAARHAGIPFV